MSENLYCPGQKVLTEEGRENYERIFGTKEDEDTEEDGDI